MAAERNGLASRIGYWLLVALAVLIGLVSLRMLSLNPELIGPEIRQNLLDHRLPFLAHTIIGPIALIVGVFQFLPRTRRSAYHRWAGRLYVACCLVGGLAALAVALTTEAGNVAGVGFLILALLWIGVTAIGYLKARNRDFVAHRRWMTRSYALTAAAITLRLILAIGAVSGLSMFQAYIFAAWASWIINLVVAEWLIRREGARSPRAVASPAE